MVRVEPSMEGQNPGGLTQATSRSQINDSQEGMSGWDIAGVPRRPVRWQGWDRFKYLVHTGSGVRGNMLTG